METSNVPHQRITQYEHTFHVGFSYAIYIHYTSDSYMSQCDWFVKQKIFSYVLFMFNDLTVPRTNCLSPIMIFCIFIERNANNLLSAAAAAAAVTMTVLKM